MVDATLTVYGTNGHATTTMLLVEGFRLLVDWDEGNGNGQSGVANWDQRTVNNPWSGSGSRSGNNGAFNSIDAALDTPVFSTNLAKSGFSTVKLNPAEVQKWVNRTVPNYGLLLRSPSEESGTEWIGVASSEDPDPSVRPKLSVTYSVAEPTSAGPRLAIRQEGGKLTLEYWLSRSSGTMSILHAPTLGSLVSEPMVLFTGPIPPEQHGVLVLDGPDGTEARFFRLMEQP